MKNAKKAFLLFLALLMPAVIFIFLKTFGKNEFDVTPLFQTEVIAAGECNLKYVTPYRVADSTRVRLQVGDSLTCLWYKAPETPNTLRRVREKYKKDRLAWRTFEPENKRFERQCIYLLQEPFDVVLVDNNGSIRGQYDSRDRDEVDRLFTEIAVLLKKY